MLYKPIFIAASNPNGSVYIPFAIFLTPYAYLLTPLPSRLPTRETIVHSGARSMLIFRHILRSWLKKPGLLFAVTVSLGLGIGASCTIYSVVYRAIFQPPPFDHPERLAVIWESFPARRFVRGSAALANIAQWRTAA